MFMLLIFFTATGIFASEEEWTRNMYFSNLEQCTKTRIEFQVRIDEAIRKDKGKTADLAFVCVPTTRRMG